MKWYKGEPLIQIIDDLSIPDRDIEKPFRMSINNYYQSVHGKLKGFCISGKIESGMMKKGQTYLI